MKLLEAKEILEDYQRWRKGYGDFHSKFSPIEISNAIEAAIDALRLLDDIRSGPEMSAYWKNITVQMSAEVWKELEKLN